MTAIVDATTAGRPDPTSPVVCNAPFVSMEFDAFGNVQACCANALYPLGNVTRASLQEIWTGARAQALRSAIRSGDLAYGCMVCRYRWERPDGEVPRDYYDEFDWRGDAPDWPQLLCLSLHNTCNLACIMCGADASSKIRSRRTDLPPLPHLYGDRFFEELEPFLRHATAVDLVGGEPFLVREHARVWDLLRGLDEKPKLSLTTNGTVWNDSVEAVLHDLDVHICVSVDGVTPETFERVRVGASFDVVMTNLERFRQHAESRGTGVHLSFSMVKENWFELGSVLQFADERGMEVSVQTVIEPEFGVQCLPTAELEIVVRSLEAEGELIADTLDLNRPVWERQVTRLQGELEDRRIGTVKPILMKPPDPENPQILERSVRRWAASHPSESWATEVEDAEEELRAWANGSQVATLGIDQTGIVLQADLRSVLPESIELPTSLVGTAISATFHAIEQATSGVVWICEEVERGDQLLHTVWYGSPHRDKQGLVHRMITVSTPSGATVLLAADFGLLGSFLDSTSARPITTTPQPIAVQLGRRSS